MRPDLIYAEVQLIGSVLIGDGALTRQQKEYIFLVCSAANHSTYCRAANIPVVLKALLNFAAKLNGQPMKVTSRDIDALRTYGYTDEQILEAVLMVGLAKFANFVAFGLGTAPDFDPSKMVLAHTGVANG